jgi:hypothetical protein
MACSSSSSSDAGTNPFGNDGGFGDTGLTRHDSSTSHDSGVTHNSSKPVQDTGVTGQDATSGGDAVADRAEPTDSSDKDTAEASNPCGYATLQGNVQQDVQNVGSIPTAEGGTIQAGTFVLRSLYYYPGGGQDASAEALPDTAQKTFIFGIKTYSWAQATGMVDAGLGASTLQGGTFSASGTTVTFDEVCPTSGRSTYQYTATLSTLSLYTTDHEEDYVMMVAP